MEYKQLRSYLSKYDEYENEFSKRFDSFGTFATPLYPYLLKNRQTSRSKYPLFVVPLHEIQLLSQQLMENSEQIKALSRNLPGIANNQFYREQLFRAIISTNEIEGVKTTHQEVSQAYEAASRKSNKPVRLKSTLKLYDDIMNSDKIDIHQLEDIREIYDRLVEGEIAAEEMPNGVLFREQVAGSRTVVGKHIPPQTELEISRMLQSWIEFINNHDFPFLIRAALGHFFFENVHPFNDGNGRAGRYIFSRYLSKKLDTYSGLVISQKINENKAKYYKAFENTGDAINRADGTLFVKQMLEFIESGQEDIITTLQEKTASLRIAEQELANSDYTSAQKFVLFLLYQSQLFTDEIDDGIKDTTIHELAKAQALSVKAVQRAMKELEEMGEVQVVTGRPLRHIILNPIV